MYWYRNNTKEFWLSFSGGALLMGLLWIGVSLFVSSTLTPTTQASTQQAPEKEKTQPADPPKVYDYNPPPIEVEYRKDFAEGVIDSVKFNGDGPYSEDKLGDKINYHYVPDWTDVVYLPTGADRFVTLQFCGNVLNKFDPNTKIKMMLHATNVGDYNDCYKSSAPITFKGSPLPPSTGVRSSVPGSSPK